MIPRTLSNSAAQELGKFADPFLLPSLQNVPLSLMTAMDYCKFLYHQTPMYRAVSKRIVGHFVTQLDFRGNIGSPEEREQFAQFFTEELGGMGALRISGEEERCYGNSFLRLYFPFVRILVDHRRDLAQYSLSMFPEELVTFDIKTITYSVPDPARSDLPVDQRPKITLTPRDIPGKDFSKIRLVTLDPRYVRLRFCEWSLQTQVQYSFSPEFKAKVKKGNLHTVNTTPVSVLQCISQGQDFLFNSDAVYHLKNETIVGVSNDGWGLPEILAHYPAIHKIAVYDRIDESIGHDHLMPMRILTPNFAGMTDQHRLSTIAAEWSGAAGRMIEEQRMDRTAIHSFPFQCSLQSLGGEGKNLAPKDLKEFEVGNLINGMNYPAELVQMALSNAQTPTAIRLFESTHFPLSQGLIGAAKFAVSRISRYMHGEAYDAVLRASQIANDIERRSLIFNLYAGGEIPRRVAFEGLGLDQPTKLKAERAKEDMDIQEQLQQLEQDAQRRAALGSLNEVLDSAGSGGQGAAGPAAGVTPTDLRAQGEQRAQEWLAIPSDGARSQAMQQTRATNPDLYAVAKDLMEQLRARGASEGRQAVAQQAQQPGQPA